MSTENLEPISPTEAARILSNQRWGGGEEREQAPQPTASEEQQYFGKEATERGQGFEPMPLATPIPKPDDTPIDSSDLRPQERPATEPTPIQYNHLGGPRHGEKMDERLVVGIDQAAHDLGQYREAVAQNEQAQLDAEIKRAIDQLRAGDQQQQQPVEQAQQPAEPQQQQEYKPAEVGDPEIQKLLESNPRLLEALAAHQWQAEQSVTAAQTQAAQQAEQLRAQYQAELAQAVSGVYAGFVGAFPEFGGVPLNQLQTAIGVVAKQNPQRAQDAVRYLDNLGRAIDQHQRVAQQQAQVQQQQWQQQQAAAQYQWQQAAIDADARYDEWSRQFGDAHNAETRKEALAYLKQELGLSDKQIAAAWNTGALRSYEAQRLLHDAARFRILQRGVAEKKVTTAPPVQRPSSPLERGSEQDYSMRQLESRLNETGSPKDAARLLQARRNARR